MRHRLALNATKMTLKLIAAAIVVASFYGSALAQQSSPGRGGPDNPGSESEAGTACIAAPCNPPIRLPKAEDQRQCSCDLRRMETRNGVVLVRDCYVQVDGRVQYCETRY